MSDSGRLLQTCIGKKCRFRLSDHWIIEGSVESFDGKWLSVQTKKSVALVHVHQGIYPDIAEQG